MKTCIVVAAHKKYRMPEDPIYLPVQVGAKGKESIGYQRDDQGINISAQNASYCELTGLYWAWKNIKCEYLGLAHYRRHFSVRKKGKDPFLSVLAEEELNNILKDYAIVLPKKRMYYIETLESHFNHMKLTTDDDLKILRDAIIQVDEAYVDAFDSCISRKGGHMFNMFVMQKDYADQYCSWLFEVLNAAEENLDMSTQIHPSRKRIIGYLSEFMIDVWIKKNGYSYKEIDTVFMEKNNEFKKVFKFIIRKFRK